ncbi:type II toxin-antitoxin system Phd/YefM family antitoxin [Pelistega suis]|uniref:type II toxin-antitoxin system Phd/YefM family antitoxin n=1 Tax=Pelistega suis TaxID=1631957 RepID=UPI00211CE664|nr:type II toxin-antitoxin system Phd/YefM family antitoxin [Pelistega suis]MCQ9328380.1 type II toxin-antitoxin system Phd/YefM family antitoxin [Pelistega suis]
MDSMTANDAKTRFGELLFDVQHTPIQVTKNGKPVAVVMSFEEYKQIEELRLAVLKFRLQKAQQDIQTSNFVEGDAFLQKILNGDFDVD